MAKDNFDILIEKACKTREDKIREIDNIKVPNCEETFKKLRKKIFDDSKVVPLKKNRTPKGTKVLRYASIVAAVLIICLLSSIIIQTETVEAFRFNVMKIFIDKKEQLTVRFNSFVEKQDKLDEGGSQVETDEEVITQIFTKAEAIEKIPFSIKVPGYLPKGFSGGNIIWKKYKSGSNLVEQSFQNEEDGIIKLEIQYPINQVKGAMVIEKSDMLTKEIKINNQKVVLMTHKDMKYTNAFWFYNEFKYRIVGTVQENEMIKIIESLQILKSGE